MARRGLDNVPRFACGDYVHWPEGERWELIDGVAYDMTPSPGRLHQRIVAELVRQLGNVLYGGPCEVCPAPFDVRLPDADEADEQVQMVVQPDISVVCDPRKLDECGCRGAPDLIIELLSPLTVWHDQTRKVALYEKHGVCEYWIVSPEERIVKVRFLGGEEGRYGLAQGRGRSSGDCGIRGSERGDPGPAGAAGGLNPWETRASRPLVPRA